MTSRMKKNLTKPVIVASRGDRQLLRYGPVTTFGSYAVRDGDVGNPISIGMHDSDAHAISSEFGYRREGVVMGGAEMEYAVCTWCAVRHGGACHVPKPEGWDAAGRVSPILLPYRRAR